MFLFLHSSGFIFFLVLGQVFSDDESSNLLAGAHVGAEMFKVLLWAIGVKCLVYYCIVLAWGNKIGIWGLGFVLGGWVLGWIGIWYLEDNNGSSEWSEWVG